jgi:hypothetical protein
MSWLFSRALVVAFSEESSSDGAACALWSGMPMPQACLWHGKTTAAWSRFPSGMTCEPLTDVHGEAVLTWFLAGFPARTFPALARERESTGSEAGCGWRWRESSVRWDRDSCSWRTRQCSLFEGLTSSSVIWPRWGSMRNGECSERTTPELPTKDKGSGLWVPTPQAHNAKEGAYPNEYERNTPSLATHAGGLLNPTWTEWLMAWPLGWTDLGVLATDRFQQWRRSHGAS